MVSYSAPYTGGLMSDVHDDATGETRRVVRQPRKEAGADEALRIAQETIERKDRELAAANQRADEAGKSVLKANTVASNTAMARISDQEVAIKNGLSAAEKSVETATLAWRQARQQGDVEAEEKAMDALGDAKIEKARWKERNDAFTQQKPALEEEAKRPAVQPAAVEAGKDKMSDESRRWIESHPKFNTDASYRQDALDAHEIAISRKIPIGTTQYTAFLDNHLERLYGKDHGMQEQDRDRGGERERSPRRGPDRGASSGATPSRDRDGSFAYNGVKLGTDAQGKKTVTGDIPAEWVNAAKWNGMDPVAYAVSMLEIEEERSRGHSPILQEGQGMVLR